MSEQQSLEHTARLLGRKEERKRIIKLLDEAETYQQLERAIALIKGEK